MTTPFFLAVYAQTADTHSDRATMLVVSDYETEEPVFSTATPDWDGDTDELVADYDVLADSPEDAARRFREWEAEGRPATDRVRETARHDDLAA